MNSINKISVIVPIYNSQKNLRRCVNSILEQKYQDLEVILVNDGSTDGSLQICEEFSQKDDRVLIINQTNQGVSAARNAGIQKASGDYVTFVDSDDWINEDMYKNMYSHILQDNSEICICNYYEGTRKIELNINKNNLNKNEIYECIIKNMIGPLPIGSTNVDNKIIGSIWRYIIKKSILIENNIFFSENLYLSEDLLFCLNFLYRTNKLVIDNNSYYHYEDISNSATRKFKSDFKKQLEIVFNETQKICEINAPDKEFMNNMDSMYVEMSISELVNQVHPNNPENITKRLKNIKEICEDKKFQNILKNIEDKSLKSSRKVLFELIHYKQYWLIYLLYKYKL